MIEFLKKQLEIRKNEYFNNPLRILEDYHKEKEKIEEYNGRQLLEMLQNADDEAVTEKEKICFIQLTSEQLTIANNGRRFSEKGIKSLMYSNISPKVREQNKVGQKGLGFRSILSWANKITIKSYDFTIEFSENEAKKFLQSLIKENSDIQNILLGWEVKEKYPIATLRCPKILDSIPKQLSEYDTYIVIDLKENQIHNVQEQINTEVNKEVLLFLNNLEKIVVESPERNFTLKKKFHKKNTVEIDEFDNEGNIILEKIWNIKFREGTYKNKKYELKIAWNDELDDTVGRLYSFFKTNVKFPFPALIHGTFDLTSDRNHFTPMSEYNTFLTDELIQLLIDTSIEISKNEVSYKPLKLLSIQGRENFDTFFDDNDFSRTLKDKIRENKIFPTIAEQYISRESKPVFYENNYAAILPKEKFPYIMLFSEDEEIIDIVKWLEIDFHDKEEYLFKSISEISDRLNIEQRARLIYYLASDFGSSFFSKDELPNIFIDQDNNIIDSSSEIFLPPSGERIKIPIKLNLKIINPELYNKLKEIFDSDKAEVITEKLKLFGIKVYRFSEIFRRIVLDSKKNSYKKNKRESIKNLLSNLYELYESNMDKEGVDISIPTNVSIPILNRNNGGIFVNKVYLGKEYDNKLCELLFQFDKRKLVGSPRILGLQGKENLREFLLWLGVEGLPRKKLIELERSHPYGKFAIRNFPFKDKRIYPNDVTLTSYKRLEEKGYRILQIKVETIDDLNRIFQNNPIENILYWLKFDSRILGRTEINDRSYIEIEISRKWSYQKIKSGDILSCLLWKMKNLSWVKTATGQIAKPAECCISKTITKDFSPFIEIPKIDYNEKLLKDAKITHDDITYFLLKIGCNKNISDFPTDTIYEMLSNLHEIDTDGKKARLIYRELAENLDIQGIDKDSDKYKEFIKHGLVYCKKNDIDSYQSVRDVYYVEDKTFGEDIIKQFYTICIDRRKGSKKIHAIFGVAPLEKLEFSLKTTPIIHKLNDTFQKELEILKPYIYSFRVSKDTDGKELNWIKYSRITLCTQIEPRYKDDEDLHDFKLKPYEFIYIENKNEVYLLINDGDKYNSMADLQSDYKFAEAIAQIYSSIIKVDSHRVSFSRLFEANTEKRSYIIKTELDDENLEKLSLAKKKLNVVDDPKTQFWFAVFSTLNKNYEYRKYKEAEFTELVKNQIDLNLNNFELDYNHININLNVPIIIKLFIELQIDISDFNVNSTTSLNIIPYYEQMFRQYRVDFENRFQTSLFHILKDRALDEKETFLDKLFVYEKCGQNQIENSVNVDIKQLFIKSMENIFQIDLSKKYKQIDIDEIYKNNKNDLIKKLKKNKKQFNEKLFNEIINGNNRFQSLLYFGEFEKIIDKYLGLYKKQNDKKEIKFNNKTLKTTKENFEELYKLLSDEDPTTKIEEINTKKPDIRKKRKKVKGGKKEGKSKIDKETLGCIGEVVVYSTLKKKFGTDNVVWDSGYAKKANVNPKGDDSKNYDIKYRNSKGIWNFVEVKTTASDKLEFRISSSEVNFGIENKSNYEIMIVINALDDKKNRVIKKVVNPFLFDKDESFTSNSKFLINNDNFTVKFIEEYKS